MIDPKTIMTRGLLDAAFNWPDGEKGIEPPANLVKETDHHMQIALDSLRAAGLYVFTKQQAIDYVLDLPIEDFNDTPLNIGPSAGARLRTTMEGDKE